MHRLPTAPGDGARDERPVARAAGGACTRPVARAHRARAADHCRPTETTPRWSAMAASLIVAIGIGWLAGSLIGHGTRETDELIAGYIRVAMSDHGVEGCLLPTAIPSSRGSPAYRLFAAGPRSHGAGLPAARRPGRPCRWPQGGGARLPPQSAPVGLTLWPSSSAGNAAPGLSQRDGFALADWRHGGFEMRAVADLAPSEMKSFAAAVDQRSTPIADRSGRAGRVP